MVQEPATEPSRNLAGWLAFGTCCAIWGSTFLVIRIGNDAVPPLWAASLRLALASILLIPMALRTRSGLPRGAALRSAAQFGFLNYGVSFCLLYWGEAAVPSGLTAVVYGLLPFATALFAWAFGLERLNALKMGAALVALAGVAMIFSGEIHAAVPPARLAAVIVAAISASLSGVLLKKGPRQHPLGTNAIAALVGLVVCLGASFLTGERHVLPSTRREIVPIVYLAVAGSAGAFVLFAWLVNHWKVTRISFIAVVVPVVALALGSLVRHETLTAFGLAGTVLVFCGLALGIAADRITR